MILVAYRHGLRVSELVDLRWDQMDFRTAALHVRRARACTHKSAGNVRFGGKADIGSHRGRSRLHRVPRFNFVVNLDFDILTWINSRSSRTIY
jgi:integrase